MNKHFIGRAMLFLPINLVFLFILLILDMDSTDRILIIFVLDVSMLVGLETILKEVKSECD